jgi:hypothetical protein
MEKNPLVQQTSRYRPNARAHERTRTQEHTSNGSATDAISLSLYFVPARSHASFCCSMADGIDKEGQNSLFVPSVRPCSAREEQ